jgi:kynurenine formamidase
MTSERSMAARYHLAIVLPMVRSSIIALCVSLVACEGNTPEPQAPTRKARPSRKCPPPRHQIVDLTHPMQEGMPVWPGGVPFKMTRLADYDRGYRLHKLEMGENTGTHVDAPSHFVSGKRSIAELPIEELVVAAVVVDLKERVRGNPDYLVSVGDIGDWEAAFGPIPPASIVIANTGWHTRFRDPTKYFNQDANGVLHFPGFSVEAARLLVERDVAAIGIDSPSLDHGPSKTFDTHKAFLAANRYGVENLANLDKLPPTGATLVVGVLPVVDGSQAQARVIAMVPEKDEEPSREEPDKDNAQ